MMLTPAGRVSTVVTTGLLNRLFWLGSVSMSTGAMLSADPPAYRQYSKKPLGLGELTWKICVKSSCAFGGHPRACIVNVKDAVPPKHVNRSLL